MKKQILADYNNPLVQSTARDISKNSKNEREKIEAIFHYVRDDIKFAFCQKGDIMKASETIAVGVGQCNNKSTLFLALSRALGIKSRIHFSLIDKKIQQGLFLGLMYKIMPNAISHSWIDVYVDKKWRRIDSFINDRDFYLAGKDELRRRNWDTGFSISCSGGDSSMDFNIDEEKFVQMDAVIEDQGYFDDPMEYYESSLYKNRPSFLKLFIYRLAIGRINKRVQSLRKNCSTGLCGSPIQSEISLVKQNT